MPYLGYAMPHRADCRCRHWAIRSLWPALSNRAYKSLLYQIAASCVRRVESFAKIKRMLNQSPTCPTVRGIRATGLAVGAFRNYLLAMPRHRKRPQKTVNRLRCIMTGGQIQTQVPRGRVYDNNIVCKTNTFPWHQPVNGEVEAQGLSDGALILERHQHVPELALGSRRCRATCPSASVRPCDILSQVLRCLILGIHKAPWEHTTARIARTRSLLRERPKSECELIRR